MIAVLSLTQPVLSGCLKSASHYPQSCAAGATKSWIGIQISHDDEGILQCALFCPMNVVCGIESESNSDFPLQKTEFTAESRRFGSMAPHDRPVRNARQTIQSQLHAESPLVNRQGCFFESL